jgi:hypothetical protein
MEELMAFIREDLGSMLNDKHDVYSPGSLESLPCELIVMIAEYLSKKDLLTLRSLGNRNISRGIDDRFVSKIQPKYICYVLHIFEHYVEPSETFRVVFSHN